MKETYIIIWVIFLGSLFFPYVYIHYLKFILKKNDEWLEKIKSKFLRLDGWIQESVKH